MNDTETLIDSFLRHYSSAQSDNSFSYLTNYYLKKGLINYHEVFVDLILNAKPPESRFLRAMNWFYSSSFIAKGSTSSFNLLMNSERLIKGLGNKGIIKAFEGTDLYLRNGKNLNETEVKLYDIFQNSILKESYEKLREPLTETKPG